MNLNNVTRGLTSLILCLLATLVLRADDPTPPKSDADSAAALAAGLKWQTGAIDIKDGLAKINLTDDFRYLNAQDSAKVLHDLWGNPQDPTVLGMIFPKDKGPLDRGSWAVTVSYEGDGYVKDDDADKIDYTSMLKDMQNHAHEDNAERVKQGYPTIDIIGWAAPPRYDKASHKLYWAKEIKFGDDKENTLNYDIRILGRRGVLVLGAIAQMDSFAEIDKQTPAILAMVDFQTGNQYADFDPKVDKIAEYGLGALVAGGVIAGAAKLGIFAILAKFFVAGFKFILIGLVALGASAKKIWGKIRGVENR